MVFVMFSCPPFLGSKFLGSRFKVWDRPSRPFLVGPSRRILLHWVFGFLVRLPPFSGRRLNANLLAYGRFPLLYPPVLFTHRRAALRSAQQ